MIDLQRVEHVLHIDAEELRLGAVDVEIDLRRRGLEQREDLATGRASCAARAISASAALAQRRRAAAGAILDHHAEAAGVADAADRRRQHRDDEGVLDDATAGDSVRPGWRPPTGRGSAARFSNGSSTRNSAPAFGALVKVAPEKPTMFTAWATPGTPSAISSARCCTASVRASDAPGGNWTTTMTIAAVDLRDEADRRRAERVEAERRCTTR